MIFKVDMTLYVEAANEALALGVAELNAFKATEALRQANSGMTTDKITTLVSNKKATKADSIPKSSYCKEILIKAFGEKKAIRFLNFL